MVGHNFLGQSLRVNSDNLHTFVRSSGIIQAGSGRSPRKGFGSLGER